MPRINLTVQPELYEHILRHKPKALSLAKFCSLLVEEQTLGLDRPSRLPAYRVGAGTSGNGVTESGLLPQSEQSSTEDGLPPLKIDTDLSSLCVMGEGVGRESEGTPRKDPKQVSGNLLAHEDLIRDFWRVKGGSKGERAWSLLQTELTKIQEIHGDGVLRQQLELAINGKWKGVTLANLERFTPARPTQPVSPSGAPMTHMEQTVASFIRKQRAMEEGRAVA